MPSLNEKMQIAPKAGALLLSEPFLPDDNFKRTVVLLCEHDVDEGSFGFVVNRPLGVKVHEAVEDFPPFDANLHLGGPVENNTLHYLHRLGDKLPDSIEVVDGLWWGGSYEVLQILIENKEVAPADIRLFVGYSGWSPGQLEEELVEKSWIVTQGTAQHIFQTEVDALWKKVLQQMGGQYQIMSNFPESPLLN